MRKSRQNQTDAETQGGNLFYFFFGSLILIIPLFFLSDALDRTLMPRLMLLAILLLAMTLLLFGRKWTAPWAFSTWRHAIFLLMLAFLLVTIVSAFFAYNYKESLFDITKTILLLSGTGMAALLLNNRKGIEERLSKLFILAAGIACLIGLTQYLQFVTMATTSIMEDGRHVVYQVTGLFSHKNIHSAFLMLLLPFTAYGAVKLSKPWQVTATITSILILILVVMLRTRSVWLGGSIGVFVFVIVLLIYADRFSLGRRWKMIIMAAMGIGIAGFILLYNLGDREDDFSFRNRIRSIADTRSAHNIHRLKVWSSTVDMASDRPLTGVGPGNWKLIAPAYFAPKFNLVDELIWIRPHNDYLWVLAEKGVIGFLLFIGLFFTGLFYLFRVIAGKSAQVTSNDRLFALFLFAGLIIYMIDSAFSFPYERTEVQMILMIYLAVSVVLYNKISPAKPLNPPPKALLTAGILIFGFAILFASHTIRMEVNLKKSINFMNANNWQSMLEHAVAAKTPLKSNGPLIEPPEYLEGLAYIGMSRHAQALEPLKISYKLAPYNVKVMGALAQTYFNLEDMESSKIYLQKIIDLFPSHREVTLSLARIYHREGAYEDARQTLRHYPAWEEDPEIRNMLQSLENR